MNTRNLSLLAALATLAAGCINNDASIRIYGLCTPPTPSDTGSCLYPAACETLALGRLKADIDSSNIDGPLVWPVQIDNQRPSNADRAGGVETAFATIQGYKISYSSATLTAPDQDVPALPGEHPINPGGTTVVLVPIVTRGAGTFLAPQVTLDEITASIRVYGTYGDGSSFETGPLSVQATLCKNCLGPKETWPDDYCKDSTKPVLTGICPQDGQSAIVTCAALPAP